MDFIEKARLRLEHWITHNDHHQDEYEMFAEQLESEGKKDSSAHVREMVEMTAKGTECLRNTLKALE